MAGIVTIGVEHNFETAHRLPFLGGKCTNLHGHSWKVKINFLAHHHESGMNDHGIALDYGLLKKVVREWIDDKLDHGCMLGSRDLLLPELLRADSKVFVFGNLDYIKHAHGAPHVYNEPAHDRTYPNMPWPTVEATARMLAEKLLEVCDMVFNEILWINTVEVRETATNTALWIPQVGPGGRLDRHGRLYAETKEPVPGSHSGAMHG